MSPSRPCFYLICCDCHMLMSDYSAWGTTPRWTRKQNALLGIFLRLGKMFLKQMHPESDLQHFPSQAWVSRDDDESLECFFMQHMTFEKKDCQSLLIWCELPLVEVFSIFNIFGHMHTKQFCQVTSICPEQSQDDLPPRRMSWLPQAEKMLYHCQCHIMWFWRLAYWSWIACLQLLRAIWSVSTHLNTPMEEHAK